MESKLNLNLVSGYHSPTQVIRVMSEYWVHHNVYCPNCGASLSSFPNNHPVGDFFCEKCSEQYELKSKKNSFGSRITDGTWQTMVERLDSLSNPSFFFLTYEAESFIITNFAVIPKHYFLPEYIEKRTPLPETARRAGWVGCNILLTEIPESGKIYYIKNKQIALKEEVLYSWKKTVFLRETQKKEAKGWLLDLMKCIEKIDKNEFSLHEVYAFENHLAEKHTNNKNIRPKIRQQLQILRDKGYLRFIRPGVYARE